MGIINKGSDRELIALQTEVKLLREQCEKNQSTMQTMNKHLKYLVHMCKLANPDFREDEVK